MTEKNPHIGSSFDDWLEEEGIAEEVTARAIKSVIAEAVLRGMKEAGLTKTAMAERMGTSRAQLDRLLDPGQSGVTLETLMKAAKAIGRRLSIELRSLSD